MTDTPHPLPLFDGLWTVERSFRTMGLPIASRGTLVRLPDDGLAVINPPPLDDALAAAVADLGPPRHLVCPNRFHHLFVSDWARRWPEARIWTAPGLPGKRPDLEGAGQLTADGMPWTGTMRTVPMGGMPRLSEVWFYHRPSGTLVATDLLARVTEAQPWFLRLWSSLNGAPADGRVGSARWLRLLVRDPAALRLSLDAALAERPRCLVVGHGEPWHGDVAAVVPRVLRRLMPAAR